MPVTEIKVETMIETNDESREYCINVEAFVDISWVCTSLYLGTKKIKSVKIACIFDDDSGDEIDLKLLADEDIASIKKYAVEEFEA